MQIHFLPASRAKSKRRVGRGGKRGSYSGKGMKGQKSRAGRRIRPALRDLILRFPKRRGFNNRPQSAKPIVVNLGDILRFRPQLDARGGKINREFLLEAGLISPHYRGQVKILGNGQLNTALEIDGLLVSESAKAKIEKAGGKVVAPKK